MRKAVWLLAICLFLVFLICSFGGCQKKPDSEKSALVINTKEFGWEWDGDGWLSPNGKINWLKTSIKAKIVEEGSLWRLHHFEEVQLCSHAPLPGEGYPKDSPALALRLDDGLTRYLWLSKVKRVDKERTGKYRATMVDGSLFTGEWETSRFHGYSHEIQEERVEGLIVQNEKTASAFLPISHIKSLTIDADVSGFQSFLDKTLSKKHPLSVRLKDGQQFTGFYGYIVDYCGHYGSTSWHERLDEGISYYVSESQQRQWISIEQLETIEFTGKFSKNQPSCPEVLLHLTGGGKKQVFLELTTESYGGVECHGNVLSSFDALDCCMLLQDYGGIALPLDLVQSISIQRIPSK